MKQAQKMNGSCALATVRPLPVILQEGPSVLTERVENFLGETRQFLERTGEFVIEDPRTEEAKIAETKLMFGEICRLRNVKHFGILQKKQLAESVAYLRKSQREMEEASEKSVRESEELIRMNEVFLNGLERALLTLEKEKNIVETSLWSEDDILGDRRPRDMFFCYRLMISRLEGIRFSIVSSLVGLKQQFTLLQIFRDKTLAFEKETRELLDAIEESAHMNELTTIINVTTQAICRTAEHLQNSNSERENENPKKC